MNDHTINQTAFRTALGHFPSGIVIVTTVVDGKPVGLAAQSFASLSLDPPLIMFAPALTSRTWKKIEQSQHFSVSILSKNQKHISTIFGSKLDEKFQGLSWDVSPQGNPIVHNCILAMDARVENIYPGGDHHIVVGRVTWISELHDDLPLLYYQGKYLTVPDLHQA